jgi:hypothetical protein
MKSELKATHKHLDKKHRIKNLIKNVLYNSFAQALYKIFTTNRFVLKTFLLIFVLASTCLASFMVISVIINYFTYGVVTTTRTLNEIPSKFPQITICNYNMFTTEYALEFLRNMSESMKKTKNDANIFSKNEVLNKSYQTMMPKVTVFYKRLISYVNSDSFSNENRKKLGHRLKDILHNCKFNTIPCDFDDFTWEFDPVYGNCYKFNSGFNSSGQNIDLKESTIAGPLNGLQFDLFVNVNEDIKDYYYSFLNNEFTSNNFNALGAVIKIDNSSYLTDHSKNGGIKIASGFHTDLSIYRKFNFNLPKPYSSCELDNNNINQPISKSDNTILQQFANSRYQYTQQSCIIQCNQLNVIKKYNCSHPAYFSIFNANVCQYSNNSLDEIVHASQVWRDSAKYNFSQRTCLPLCPLECNQTIFDTKLSSLKTISWKYYLGLIERNLSSGFLKLPIKPETATESFVSLSIFYESLSYSITTESPQMDWISLLGSIGGNLGLFLGVSFFSLCELVEVLIEIYFIEKN